MTKFRVDEEAAKQPEPEREFCFRLIERYGGQEIDLIVCDKNGERFPQGHVLNINEKGVDLIESMGDFGIAKDGIGRIVLRPAP